jgi:hypothetical protein
MPMSGRAHSRLAGGLKLKPYLLLLTLFVGCQSLPPGNSGCWIDAAFEGAKAGYSTVYSLPSKDEMEAIKGIPVYVTGDPDDECMSPKGTYAAGCNWWGERIYIGSQWYLKDGSCHQSTIDERRNVLVHEYLHSFFAHNENGSWDIGHENKKIWEDAFSTGKDLATALDYECGEKYDD